MVDKLKRGPGRPSLDLTPVLVRLPTGLPEQIDNLVGKNRRAEFIRDAVLREIALREGSSNA
ncbi:hypothetical protein [Rhizobium sp. Leaf371]|uniref:hypothetical protein n=1 Tax=Rhizobium sp. Leaf371 TaxID=1736355 RepID=UPI0009E8FEC8|nr:hypothetical protein [Rhizobium sp. Leaf371]